MEKTEIGPPTPTGESRGGKSGTGWRRIGLGLLVSVLSLIVVFYFVDLDKFQDAIRLADYRLIVLAVVTTLVWLLVRAFFWRTLLQEQASFRDVFLTLNEGYLLNNLLPFRLGEIGRAFLLSRKAPVDFWQVLSSILIERLLDLVMAVALLLGTLPLVIAATWERSAALGTGLFVLIAFVGLFLLARYREAALNLFERLAARWPVLQRLGGNALPAFLKGLAVLTSFRRFVTATGWEVLNWLVAVFQYTLLIGAFFPHADLLWAAFGLSVAALGLAAPSSPGALGVFEAALVGALSLFKLDPSTSLALALTAHLLQVLTTGVIGIFALTRDGESLLGLYKRVRVISVEKEA